MNAQLTPETRTKANRRVEVTLAVAIGVVVLLLLVIGAYSLRTTNSIGESSRLLEHTHSVLGVLDRMQRATANMKANRRSYYLSGNERYLERSEMDRSDVYRLRDSLRILTVDNPRQQSNIQDLSILLDAWFRLRDTTLMLYRSHGLDIVRQRIVHADLEEEQYGKEKVFQDMRAEEDRLLADREQTARERVRASFAASTVLAGFIILILPLAFIFVRRDLRARAAVERALQRSEYLSSALIRNFPNGSVLVLDHDLRFLVANGSTLARWGLTSEQMVGRTIWECLPPDLCAIMEPHYRRALTGPAGSVELAFPADTYEIQMLPLRDESGVIWAGMLMTQVVTPQVQLRESLARMNAELERRVAQRTIELSLANQELQRSNQELQDFAHVASHDLQEPLRKIRAFSDRLQEKLADTLPDEARDYLRRMHSAAGRMSTLINDLLAFSRVTTQAHPYTRVDLQIVLRDVVDDLQARIDATHGVVTVEALPEIDGDLPQMRQLFQNLVGNALKFHAPGQVPKVRVSVASVLGEGAERRVTILVEDNGIGFDEKYLDRVFTIFQRLHGREEYEGTGLGLAICRKIVLRHGGSITARSTPGQGATFEITLPMSQSTETIETIETIQ